MATKTTKPNDWRSLAPWGKTRKCGNGICTNDHQLLMIGEDYDRKTTCEYYDLDTETWTDLPKAKLIMNRDHFGVASVGEQVFVVGGEISLTIIPNLISLTVPGSDCAKLANEPLYQEWKNLSPMKEARKNFACVSHSNSIYVFGGKDSSFSDLDTVERYDIETDTWTQLPKMPYKCSYSAAGVVGNKIYVVGGSCNLDEIATRSTIVFDVSKQQWESPNDTAIPDMSIGRIQHSVVTVGHFVVAIGGRGSGGNSIEILDTTRNTWKSAKTSMKHPWQNGVARYFNKSKEIIVVGGRERTVVRDRGIRQYETLETLKESQSIHFENGLLPASYQFKERGQEMIGDTDRGEDRLGVAIIAIALAELLVFKDLRPPFVLAVFGKWGRGKSYFFNLMQEELIKIQKRPVDKIVRNTFSGHIYIVKFDAWTFSKGDVWSSLMYQILKTLNEQLQFEENLGKDALLAGDVSTIEVFRDLSTLELEHLENHQGILQKIKKDGDRASERLLRAINADYEQDQLDLENIEKRIHHETTKKQAISAVDEIKRHLNFLGKNALNKALKRALEESTESGGKINIDDMIKSIKVTHRFFLWCYSLQLSNIPPSAMICSALLIVFSTFMSLTKADRIVAIISGFLSAVIPVVTSISAVLTKIDPVITNLERQAGDNDDAQPGSVTPLLGVLPGSTYGSVDDDTVLKDLKNQKFEIENRALALKGHSLRDTIAKKIDSSEYEKNLGIVHKVQQDLKLISDGMLNKRQKDIFPRGDPRIVLFIDDLDRCKHSEVVKVIEALQLLVKTKLFVAVLAIDPRYVTLSLEKHYHGILDPVVPPTGMDFLEKMIQIPFRLPGVGPDSVGDFLDNEISVEDIEDDQENLGAVFNDSGIGNDSDIVEAPVDTLDTVQEVAGATGDDNVTGSSQAAANTPGAINASISQEVENVPLQANVNVQEEVEVEEDLPSNKINFTSKEKLMMKEILQLFGVEPRCLRRIINVFKVLKVIWRRDSTGRFEDSYEMKRATLFLMLLASDNLTRRVTYKIFHWMELGSVQYHRVMNHEQGQSQNNLANLIKRELHKDTRFNCPPSIEATRDKGTLMSHIDKYLSDYTWKNCDEWNAVSLKFLLARSFSFFRLVTTDMDSIEQHLMNKEEDD